jgi:hypothetical protein
MASLDTDHGDHVGKVRFYHCTYIGDILARKFVYSHFLKTADRGVGALPVSLKEMGVENWIGVVVAPVVYGFLLVTSRGVIHV